MENEELRARLREAEETIEAIRSGGVDALVVAEPTGDRIYTLEGAERPYRLFVEEMEQGAATLQGDGTVVWCNRRLAQLLNISSEKLTGSALREFISPQHQSIFDNLLWQGQTRSGRAEAHLRRADGVFVPAFLTFNALPADCGSAIGVLITDLTSQRHHEQLTAAHAALRESEARLEAELADTRLLAAISAEMVREQNVQALYESIMDAAVGLMRSDYASMQMLYPERGPGGELRLLAFRGFSPDVARFWEWVRTDSKCTCGIALANKQRCVEPDVVKSSHIAGTADHATYLQAGIRAVQSTPLLSRDGKLVGMISTHWREPHQPSERAFRLLDVLARQAADLLERKQAEQALRESESRFREMIDALPVAIYTTDAEGRLTHFNPAAVDFSGHTPQLGSDQWCISFKLFHPDGRPMSRDECPMAIALKEGRAIRGAEAIAERPDGSRVWFTPYPTPLRDSAGRIVGGINMLVDITERKQAEEARAKLAAIVESSDDAIVSKDLNGTITSWNRGAQQLFGYTAEEAIGQPVTMLIPSDHLAEEPTILKRIRRGESINHYETVRRRKDGTLLDISLTVSPMRNDQGQVVGASKIARDISHRRRNEEALRQAQALLADRAAQLEQAVIERTAELTATNRQLEAFAYSVAHDLRAPVRAMEGFSAMLLDEDGASLSETGLDFAKRINRAAQFMDTLLTDLLTFSSTAQQRVELAPVRLKAVVESVLSRLEKEILETNASVKTSGSWPTVLAHESTLGQVLFNLVSNALKFVGPEALPAVRVRAEEVSPNKAEGEPLSGRWVRVWVEDKGIGIEPDYQQQIFKLFTRLHSDRYPGTGVGLAIVQKGIERMGGRVGVESTPGQGSRFWFELRKAHDLITATPTSED